MSQLKHAFAFDHRNANLDDKKYRYRLYGYSDPSKCIHDNANLRVFNNLSRKNRTQKL